MASISGAESSIPSTSGTAKDDGMGQFYQFKIRLLDTKPPVWRRIQVPLGYTFWGLHCAIQNSMGWHDTHLHSFMLKNSKNGKSFRIENEIEDTSGSGSPPINISVSSEVLLTKYYTADTSLYKTKYTYDFGDDWEHQITLEGIFPCEPGKSYHICVKGKRACPPEDCSRTIGFAELLINLKKKPSERTRDEREAIDWLHNQMHLPNYDPSYFDPSSVNFANPEMWLAMKNGE